MDNPNDKRLTQAQIDALPDTLTIQLDPPIKLSDNVSYDSLTFSEPTAGQLEQVSKMDDMKATIQLLAFSAGVVDAVIKQMRTRQFKQASAFVESFIQDARPTGPGA